MKKSITLVALAFGVTNAFAQDLTSKKGEPFLPEAKDWSISVDASPFLQYMGNFFGKNTTNFAPSFNHYSLNQSITGKYFKDANTAYRATIRLGSTSTKDRQIVQEHVFVAAGPTGAMAETAGQKFDQRRATDHNIVLGVGMEKRRGKTRLQGFYGADLLIWGGNTTEKYQYGNKLTQDNDNVTTVGFDENLNANTVIPGAGLEYTTNWNTFNPLYATNVVSGNNSLDGYTNVDAARVLKRKTNGVLGFGVRAFIGVEYFIVPKISIGGEFGWGVGFEVMTKDKAVWDAEGTAFGATNQTTAELKTKDDVSNGSRFVIDTDRNALNSSNNTAAGTKNYNLMGGTGTIRLNFHF